MNRLEQIQPKEVWQWFSQICAIPHPTYHEHKLAEYIINWAKSKQLAVEQDAIGNIIIRKPATKGMENRKIIVLQVHIDMVPQKNNNVEHDFVTDPIKAYIDGDWVTAEGTTLGADNGIGVASALAVLNSDSIVHPELEVLFTIEEETGMGGAFGLASNLLQAEIMLNLDTEEETAIYIGCAGGVNADISLPIEFRQPDADDSYYKVSVAGLYGGHSGIDIHLGRGNAIKILARFLESVSSKISFKLATINGGSVRNALPRDASAILALDKNQVAKLEQLVIDFEAILQEEYKNTDPGVKLNAEKVSMPEQVMSSMSTKQVINLINAVPNGVVTNSAEVAGVVETSSSLGVLITTETGLEFTVLIRSLIESGKEYLMSMLRSVVSLSSFGLIEFSSNYPGWKPNSKSETLLLATKLATEVLGYEPEIKVVHAGLECGVLLAKYPHLDVISIGPTILGAHSPDEKASIPGTQKYWELLLKLLANIPEKTK